MGLESMTAQWAERGHLIGQCAGVKVREERGRIELRKSGVPITFRKSARTHSTTMRCTAW